MQVNNWDDNYRDYAWEEMRKLLDQEQPVIPIPWWKRWGTRALFLLLLVPLAAGAIWYTTTSGNNQEASLVSVAEVTPPANQTANELASPAAHPDPEQAKSNSETTLLSTPKSIVQIPAGPNTVPVTGKTLPPATPSKSEAAIPELPLQEINPVPVEETLRVFELPVLALPAKPIAALDQEGTTPILEQEMVEPRSNRLQWGVTSAVQVGNFPGISGGIALRETIGTSRWNWQSGLEVTVQRYQRTSDNLFANFDEGEMPVDLNDTTVVDPSTFAENQGIGYGPDQVYYLGLNLPVTLAYRIGPSWRLNAGVQARYFITSGRTSEEVLTLKQEDLSYSFLESSRVFQVGGENTSYYRQRFGMAVTAGLEWQLASQLSLSSQFLFGMTDENPNLEGTQRRLAGELRLSYFFNRPTR
jgi:hypothetical protein